MYQVKYRLPVPGTVPVPICTVQAVQVQVPAGISFGLYLSPEPYSSVFTFGLNLEPPLEIFFLPFLFLLFLYVL